MALVRDFVCMAGGGLILYGLWQMSPALTFVAGGLIVIAAAAWWSSRIGRNRNDS